MAFIENPKSEDIKCCRYFFAFNQKKTILKKDKNLLTFDDFIQIKNSNSISLFFAEPENQLCVVKLEGDSVISDDFVEIEIREFFSFNSQEMNTVMSRGKSISDWLSSNIYCSKCGSKLVYSEHFSSKNCPSCKTDYFPRIEPCVIILVHREDKFLLVRHTYRNQNLFACVAGFIEAGESVEQAVAREIKEEVGIEIKNVKYKGSQGWPFPDQLMLAFTAEYAGGELKLQEEEIAEARWITKEELPSITSPKKGAVAWRLIHDDF